MNGSLFNNRMIFLTGGIDDILANSIIEQMLELEYINPYKDINLLINSQGGSVTAGFAILDVMNFLKCDVRTIGMGLCASMAAFLMAAGTKGKRLAFENLTLMYHQPHAANPEQKQVTDILINAQQAKRTKDRMIKILSENTGQPFDVVEEIFERDSFMTPTDAMDFGAIDKIIR